MSVLPGIIVPQRPPFVDDRGSIMNLVDGSFESAAVITSVGGAVRGNHYHRTDYHYCWLQSGRMLYFQRRAGATDPPDQCLIEAGTLFFTPVLYEHAMHFLEDSVMFVLARNNREIANYEADTIRVPAIGTSESGLS